MGQGNAAVVRIPGESNSEPAAGSAAGVPEVSGQDVLTDILRDGAQRLLSQAVEAEVAAYIEAHAGLLATPQAQCELRIPWPKENTGLATPVPGSDAAPRG